jgi:hypothetical protein
MKLNPSQRAKCVSGDPSCVYSSTRTLLKIG